MIADADLRIGDAEREAAASELGEHYAQGRLDAEEHAERLDRIWSARTRRELMPVFADLPGHAPVAPVWNAGTPAPRRRGFRMPFPMMVLIGILVVVTVMTHLPIVLIGLGIWFVASRGCGPRVHRAPWAR